MGRWNLYDGLKLAYALNERERQILRIVSNPLGIEETAQLISPRFA
jgi:hypothetical protein